MNTVGNWNWFMAVNNRGQWIVCEGIAEVAFDGPAVSAILRFSPEAEPYLSLFGSIESGEIDVVGKSADGEVPDIHLQGMIRRETVDGDRIASLMLSDGWTTIGIARCGG